MEAGLPLLKFLFPQIPSISWAAAQHTLGFTPTSSKWDLRTALTVHILRNLMTSEGKKTIPPIGKVQQRTLIDPGVKGKTWVAKEVIPKPPGEEKDVVEAVCGAVEGMKKEEVRYTRPDMAAVEVEWTGYRPDAARDEAMPDISEEERYKRLMAEPSRTSETTILYFHGGAYYLCDPATHRALTSRLAKESKGRVCSVRYRLAPQTAFPGQLVDALMVYLSLLYPPEGSMHEAVGADKIVFGGDSAGGNLSFGLLQLLLQLHRAADGVIPIVKFHGRDVHVPLPAGVSANSGWFDISRSMPSIVGNAKYDYLPPANHDDAVSRFGHDDIWPTDPPRGDLFCDLSLLDHPLASLHIADSWATSPPLWMCTGQEMLTDEDTLVASRAAKQGVKVQFEQYEAMPHCFQLLLPDLPNAQRCVKSWGNWARRCVEEPESLKTEGVFVPARKGEKGRELDVVNLPSVEFEEAWGLVKTAKMRRIRGFEGEGKMMPKPAL
ncbi:hypothetical protein PRZ48_015028 [Zasmidium cellare]|uniref:Alpha/beta hydrolase fold-3 domain-containing protein n=1 Tax=Zasmidium cellare TaxID=395010 RepID=A0ABR0DY48_ZASCE|nr:hypothetical protein PRZ48_015028 [Zasmidium cellare]